ncbi:MAG: hypothetical protein KF754_12495 [Planctomycetes bacterium]|nr:hypothetical protein [Planctomycetota bacterium]
MKWLVENKLRVAKWGGLGAGCLVAALVAFVGARYVASGSEYEGGLDQLAPADASYVVHIPSVPKARRAGETFLDDLLLDANLGLLESSPMWRDGAGKSLDGGLQQFRDETLRKGVDRASRQAEDAGVRLFEDVLAGEMLVAFDAGKGGGMVALSRVSRAVRFRWQFMDLAGLFLPDNPAGPKLEYADGTLKVTPKANAENPQAAQPQPLLVALLDDVLVLSTSPRLFNATLKAHGGDKALASNPQWQRARKLPAAEDAARHSLSLWVNLDVLRKRLPPTDTGESPVDTYTSLPPSVVGVMPDILSPVNTLLAANLDTSVFSTALYGVDLSESGQVRFDQYLLADTTRAAEARYAHLRKTWAQPARPISQFALLPDDTMLEVSYRQPLDVLYEEVFTEKDRGSLVGDFIVAMRAPAVVGHLGGPVEEMLFATAPRTYAPGVTAPVPPVELPLPAFCLGFRAPGAREDVARVMLEEYLQAQRGRGQQPGEPPRTGAVVVIELALEGQRAWGLMDPRDDPNNRILTSLNNSIRAALVGDWLLLANSELLLSRAIRGRTGAARALAADPRNPFPSLDQTASSTMYVNWDAVADYVLSNGEFFKLLRSTRYNPGLLEGRDPGEVRREIAASFGLDPKDIKSLGDPQVSAEFARRKEIWLQTCQIEGDRYIADLQANFRAMRFFRDLAMTTTFAPDHLHVRGVLRTG